MTAPASLLPLPSSPVPCPSLSLLRAHPRGADWLPTHNTPLPRSRIVPLGLLLLTKACDSSVFFPLSLFLSLPARGISFIRRSFGICDHLICSLYQSPTL